MNKSWFFLLLFVCGQSLSSVPSREPTLGNLPAEFGRDFVDTAHDFGAYLIRPINWDKQDWGTFAIVTGVTGALFLVDRPLFFSVDPNKNRPLNDFLKPVLELGDFRAGLIALPMLYVGSFVFHDEKLQRASRIAIRALLFQAVIVQTMKNVVYRTKIDDPLDFRLFTPKFEVPSPGGAFPAGHSSSVWAALSAFAIAYKDDPLIPWFCYGLAVANSAALVLNRDHWISDIFFGSALGYFTAKWLAERNDQRMGFGLSLSSEGGSLAFLLAF